jgi:hypothetical protein
MAFEALRRPTDRLDIHLAGVRLGAAGAVTSQATFAEARLPGWIEQALVTAPLSTRVEYELNRLASAQASALAQRVQAGLVRRKGCGCPLSVGALFVVVAAAVLAVVSTLYAHP